MAHLMSSADRMELENIFMRVVTRNALPSEKVGALRRGFFASVIDGFDGAGRGAFFASVNDGDDYAGRGAWLKAKGEANIRHCQFCATELDAEQGEVVVLTDESVSCKVCYEDVSDKYRGHECAENEKSLGYFS